LKEYGIPFWDLMKMVIVFPFMNIPNVGAAFDGKHNIEATAQKDTYYRALANQKLDWRNLLT
jgi:hypothetical protein